MKHKITTLGAALQLMEFDVDTLAALAQAPRDTAQTVLTRRNRSHPGWATRRNATGGRSGRPRTIYAITREGREQIQLELAQIASAAALEVKGAPVGSKPLGLVRAERAIQALEAAGSTESPAEFAQLIQSNLAWARRELASWLASGASKLEYLEKLSALQQRALDLMAWSVRPQGATPEPVALAAVAPEAAAMASRVGVARPDVVVLSDRDDEWLPIQAAALGALYEWPVEGNVSLDPGPEVRGSADDLLRRCADSASRTSEVLRHIVAEGVAGAEHLGRSAAVASAFRQRLDAAEWAATRSRVVEKLGKLLSDPASGGSVGAIFALLAELQCVDLVPELMIRFRQRRDGRLFLVGEEQVCLAALSKLAYLGMDASGTNAPAEACRSLVESYRNTENASILLPGAVCSAIADKASLLRAAPGQLFEVIGNGVGVRAGVSIKAAVQRLSAALLRSNSLARLAGLMPEMSVTPTGEAFLRACISDRNKALRLSTDRNIFIGVPKKNLPTSPRDYLTCRVPVEGGTIEADRIVRLKFRQAWDDRGGSRFSSGFVHDLHGRRGPFRTGT